MICHFFYLKFTLISLISSVRAASTVPQTVQWSSRSHGPDGPWQAVTVSIGTPPQNVDLLPGGSWMSNILAPSVCANGDPCDVAKVAGFYNTSDSSSAFAIGQTGNVSNAAMSGVVGALPSLSGSGNWIFDTISLPMLNGVAGNKYSAEIQNFDMLVISGANERLPDGTTYPVQVGKLGLGAPNANQTWLHFPPKPNWNGTLLSSALFEQAKAPSNSYGMHIGSAAMGVPGSLTIGGYDQNRALGPISSQSYDIDHLPIDLLDIGIGVAEGISPFSLTSISGVLAEGNSSIGRATPVFVEAPLPYIYLPESTCNAITRHLPVTFQKKYGLYFWNTQDPDYKRIISSPSYLSFTFRLSGSLTQNITINVPFSLLDLKLTSPIIRTPTQYFPLRPGQGPSGAYTLGRAFLQAAFIGVNWQTAGGTGDGVWFLAQAPGPNIASQNRLTTIKATDNSIIGSTNDWKDTWRGSWTVLGSSNATSGGANTNETSPNRTMQVDQPPKKGLGTGVIVGIAVGVGAIILITVFLIVCLCRRSRKRESKSPQPSGIEVYNPTETSTPQIQQQFYQKSGFGPVEMDSDHRHYKIAEMQG